MPAYVREAVLPALPRLHRIRACQRQTHKLKPRLFTHVCYTCFYPMDAAKASHCTPPNAPCSSALQPPRFLPCTARCCHTDMKQNELLSTATLVPTFLMYLMQPIEAPLLVPQSKTHHDERACSGTSPKELQTRTHRDRPAWLSGSRINHTQSEATFSPSERHLQLLLHVLRLEAFPAALTFCVPTTSSTTRNSIQSPRGPRALLLVSADLLFSSNKTSGSLERLGAENHLTLCSEIASPHLGVARWILTCLLDIGLLLPCATEQRTHQP